MWDVVAGDLTGKILKNMPNKSEGFVYGMLSLRPLSIEPTDLFFRNKKVFGYNVGEFQSSVGWIKLLEARKTV